MLKAVLVLPFIFTLFGRVDEIVILLSDDVGSAHSISRKFVSLGIFDQESILLVTIEVIPIFISQVGGGILLAMSYCPPGAQNTAMVSS